MRRYPLRAALLGAVLALAFGGYVLWQELTAAAELRMVDLDVYRDAGESVLIGRPVYEHLTDPPQLLPFTYPPVAALLATPLAVLPWPAVQWLWTLMQLAVLAGVVAVAFRPLRHRAGDRWPLVVGALVGGVLWLVPLHDGFRFGQVDILLVGLCLADCAVRRTPWPRGLLVGIATAVKLTPGVFIVYLWLTGRVRAAVVATVTAVMTTVAAAIALPEDSVGYWADALFSSDRLGSNEGTSNQSLRGMLLRTPFDDTLRTALLVLCLAVVAVVGYRRARAASEAGDETAGVAVVGLLAVLLSPVAWIHHLAWVVLVLGVLVDDLRDRTRAVVAVTVGLYFAVATPWHGQDLVLGNGPDVLGTVMQDAYGLAAVGLVFLLGPRPSLVRTAQVDGRVAPPFDPVRSG